MRVKELITELEKMPMDAEVLHVWDGEARTGIEFVWLAESGYVITADFGELVYSVKSRPPSADKNDRYWVTPYRHIE